MILLSILSVRLPAELHLVHVKETYVSGSSVDPAAFSDGSGLAVVAIFLENKDATNKTAAWFEVRFLNTTINQIHQIQFCSSFHLLPMTFLVELPVLICPVSI